MSTEDNLTTIKRFFDKLFINNNKLYIVVKQHDDTSTPIKVFRHLDDANSFRSTHEDEPELGIQVMEVEGLKYNTSEIYIDSDMNLSLTGNIQSCFNIS
jgi:hypothetical protein